MQEQERNSRAAARDSYNRACGLMRQEQYQLALLQLSQASRLLRPFKKVDGPIPLLELDIVLARAECLSLQPRPALGSALEAFDLATEMVACEQVEDVGIAENLEGRVVKKKLSVLLRLPTPWPEDLQRSAERAVERLKEIDPVLTDRILRFYAEEIYWLPSNQEIDARLLWVLKKLDTRAIKTLRGSLAARVLGQGTLARA